MSGPIILGIIIVTIILLVKYPTHAKRIFVGTKQATVGFEFKNVLSVILVFVGVAIFYFGVYTSSSKSPNLADVGRMSRDHWLPILVLWGISAVLIAVNTTGTTAKTLQKVMVVGIVVVLVGLPTWSWITGRSAPTTKHKAPVSDARNQQRNMSNWTKISLLPGEKSSGVRFPIGTHPVIDGDDVLVHYKYRDGRECVSSKKQECPNGDIPFVFFSNTGSGENIFSYTFVSSVSR